MRRHKNLNEEIKRIQSLFTEERLYGNLVDYSESNDEIINESVLLTEQLEFLAKYLTKQVSSEAGEQLIKNALKRSGKSNVDDLIKIIKSGDVSKVAKELGEKELNNIFKTITKNNKSLQKSVVREILNDVSNTAARENVIKRFDDLITKVNSRFEKQIANASPDTIDGMYKKYKESMDDFLIMFENQFPGVGEFLEKEYKEGLENIVKNKELLKPKTTSIKQTTKTISNEIESQGGKRIEDVFGRKINPDDYKAIGSVKTMDEVLKLVEKNKKNPLRITAAKQGEYILLLESREEIANKLSKSFNSAFKKGLISKDSLKAILTAIKKVILSIPNTIFKVGKFTFKNLGNIVIGGFLISVFGNFISNWLDKMGYTQAAKFVREWNPAQLFDEAAGLVGDQIVEYTKMWCEGGEKRTDFCLRFKEITKDVVNNYDVYEEKLKEKINSFDCEKIKQYKDNAEIRKEVINQTLGEYINDQIEDSGDKALYGILIDKVKSEFGENTDLSVFLSYFDENLDHVEFLTKNINSYDNIVDLKIKDCGGDGSESDFTPKLDGDDEFTPDIPQNKEGGSDNENKKETGSSLSDFM